MLECVANVSEGRDRSVIDALARRAGAHLLDVHCDVHHHRSVFTLAGPQVEDVAQQVAREAVSRIDLRSHMGAHPRMGAVDVVPFVPLAGSSLDDAVAARDRFAHWAGAELGIPAFLYGPERSLPEVRRSAFSALAPDTGPAKPHARAGAVAVGARGVLVAYNLWLAPSITLPRAREIAQAVRGPHLRALGLAVGSRVQVACNLVDPLILGPGAAFDAVAAHAEVAEAELVGLLPATVLHAVPRARWPGLGLDASRTIEARLAQAGWDPPAEEGTAPGGGSTASAGRGRH